MQKKLFAKKIDFFDFFRFSKFDREMKKSKFRISTRFKLFNIDFKKIITLPKCVLIKIEKLYILPYFIIFHIENSIFKLISGDDPFVQKT